MAFHVYSFKDIFKNRGKRAPPYKVPDSRNPIGRTPNAYTFIRNLIGRTPNAYTFIRNLIGRTPIACIFIRNLIGRTPNACTFIRNPKRNSTDTPDFRNLIFGTLYI
jgi:hypothetical protein